MPGVLFITTYKKYCNAAGIPSVRAWLYYGSRVMLQARKPRRRVSDP